MEASYHLVALVFFLTYITGSLCLSYAGCFTLPPGISTATDVENLGWGDKWEVDDRNIQFCINYCVQKNQKYAGVGSVAGAKAYCVCGSERAYSRLGAADHKVAKQKCQHNTWYMNVYVASDDVSLQYIGCYKDGTGADAAQSHLWIDKWTMTPNLCINYCEANGASNANLKHGDTCTCGSGYSKFGRAPESTCNLVCAGSQGQKCGGAQANSVYSTISIGEILRPATSVITHGFYSSDVPKVPITNSLPSALYVLQQVVSNQVPSPAVRSIGNLLNKAQILTQDIIDMKDPLAGLATSPGFTMSNDPGTRKWLSSNYPPKLLPFADLIKRAHSFIDQDVQKLEDHVKAVTTNARPWLAASQATLQTLKGYVDKGLEIKGITEAIKTAQQMVSASRFCLPLMSKKKSVMTTNLETVASALIEGPYGTKKFTQLLKSPLSALTISPAAAPAADIDSWKGSITSIAKGWEGFVSQNGVKLYSLISTRYSIICPSNNPNTAVGKRSACQNETNVDFFDMVRRPGNNKAHKDTEKFVADNNAIFTSFKWRDYDSKLCAIMADFKGIEKFLVSSGIGSAADVKKLQDPFKSRQFYQTCAGQLTTMIQTACHRSSTPDESQVGPIKC